uniref:Uncharacterized protein n=1 Tax=Rhizophora mucronata TaxID=61149 RepID=A0A2P2PXY7_RHIMU
MIQIHLIWLIIPKSNTDFFKPTTSMVLRRTRLCIFLFHLIK